MYCTFHDVLTKMYNVISQAFLVVFAHNLSLVFLNPSELPLHKNMLEPLRPILSSYRVILASGSPRRREILATALPGIKIEIIPSKAEEDSNPYSPTDEKYRESAWKYPEDIAELKAKDIMKKVSEEESDAENSKTIVIGCDTVISYQGQFFGKPKNEKDAVETLAKFSGQSQTVYSGVCILRGSHEKTVFHEGTTVHFDELTNEVIEGYVKTGEPMDKAGSYGIQAMGGTLIRSISGDYYNVMGFPLNHFCRKMRDLLLQTNQ